MYLPIKELNSLYAIDMDAVIDFVTTLTSNELAPDESKSDTLGPLKEEDSEGTIGVVQRELNKIMPGRNDNASNIRYDFVKTIITVLLSDAMDYNTSSSSDVWLSSRRMAFNTLLYNGMIVDIENSDDVER